MQHNPDRIVIWPGYFDARRSRRSGRRVSSDAAVAKPELSVPVVTPALDGGVVLWEEVTRVTISCAPFLTRNQTFNHQQLMPLVGSVVSERLIVENIKHRGPTPHAPIGARYNVP